MRSKPLVEGNVKVEELLLVAVFIRSCVDHLDVEFSAFERIFVELVHIVEEISGKRAMRLDGRAVEAEVVVVIGNFLIDGRVMDCEGHERDFRPHGLLGGEETAVEVVEGGGGDLVVIGGDELDAGVVERELSVAVVGEDDADSDEAVGDIGKAEEVALFDVVAWLGRDRDMLVGMRVEGGVLIGWLYERSLAGLVEGEGGYCEQAGRSY